MRHSNDRYPFNIGLAVWIKPSAQILAFADIVWVCVRCPELRLYEAILREQKFVAADSAHTGTQLMKCAPALNREIENLSWPAHFDGPAARASSIQAQKMIHPSLGRLRITPKGTSHLDDTSRKAISVSF